MSDAGMLVLVSVVSIISGVATTIAVGIGLSKLLIRIGEQNNKLNECTEEVRMSRGKSEAITIQVAELVVFQGETKREIAAIDTRLGKVEGCIMRTGLL